MKEEKTNCWLFHKWEKWVETGRGPLIDYGQRNIGAYSRQERTCERCGLKQIKDFDV